MEQKKLKDLLSQYYFRIPDYQRGYAWGERQRIDLWEDMENMVPKGNLFMPHYTGCLYADKMDDEKKLPEESWVMTDYYYLVDGQQRITTLVILLYELLRYGKKNAEVYEQLDASYWEKTLLLITKQDGTCPVYRFSYEDPEYKGFLESVIFENDSFTRSDYKQIDSCYKQNLVDAKKFFRERIESLDAAGRNDVFVKLLNCMPFDFNPIEKEFDVQAVFETMNNRGKPLTNLEKLKNRLMFLSANMSNLDCNQRCTLRKTINQAWADIYKNLGRKDAPLPEDEFLSAHLSLIRNPKYNGAFPDDEAGEKVFRIFCSHPERWKEKEISFQTIEQYSKQLATFSNYWRNVHDSEDLLVKKILILSNTKEIKIFLSVLFLLKDKKDDNNDIVPILTSTEKILFRNMLPGTNVMDIRGFVTIAKALYNNDPNYNITTVNIDLQKTATGYNITAVCNRFVDLFNYVRGGAGFYRWGGLKYLLFDYEDNLREIVSEEKRDNQPPRINLDEFYETQIEHILPQKWEEHWNMEIHDYDDYLQHSTLLNGADFDKDKAHKILINSLGNLTILRGGKNLYVSNDSWENKKKAYLDSSYSEKEIAGNHEKWTQTEILKRGISLFVFLLKKIEYTGELADINEIVLPLHLLKTK